MDRVIADPQLDEAFLAKCSKLGLSDDPVLLNQWLFRLRKAGKLVQLATQRRTEFNWAQVDRYIFASEIAWRKMYDIENRSLDAIFCNPIDAAEFDRIAMSYAPGFTPLQYRWAALKLRKASKDVRERPNNLIGKSKTGRRKISDVDYDKLAGVRGDLFDLERR